MPEAEFFGLDGMTEEIENRLAKDDKKLQAGGEGKLTNTEPPKPKTWVTSQGMRRKLIVETLKEERGMIQPARWQCGIDITLEVRQVCEV